MITDFEDQMLTELALEAEHFEREYAQWTYKFCRGNITLQLIYSIDGTVSTSLYLDGKSISFCFAIGLQNLYIRNGEIHGEIISGKLTRTLMINPQSLEVKWEDSL